MQFIQSKLAEDFSCIADKCPANCCCAGWNITWQESEIKRLDTAGNDEISQKISCSFCGEGEYRSILYNSDGACPFLLQNGRCSIHKNLGSEYLSYTCREYPKIYCLCDDIMLKTCKISCFAVMDRLCTDNNCMKLVTCSEENVQAVIFSADDGRRRAEIFRNMYENLPFYYNKESTEKIFADIFGWEVITCKGEQRAEEFLKNNCCEKVIENITKAMFLQWLTGGFCAEFSDKDNLNCLDFCLKAAKSAIYGAAYAAEDRQQFICSVSDFIGFLLSNTKKIIVYNNEKVK